MKQHNIILQTTYDDLNNKKHIRNEKKLSAFVKTSPGKCAKFSIEYKLRKCGSPSHKKLESFKLSIIEGNKSETSSIALIHKHNEKKMDYKAKNWWNRIETLEIWLLLYNFLQNKGL